MQLYRQKRAGSREADIVRDAWHWRELLQRNMDGSDHTSDSAVGGLAEYNDLPGPWGAIPGGYQVGLCSHRLLRAMLATWLFESRLDIGDKTIRKPLVLQCKIC